MTKLALIAIVLAGCSKKADDKAAPAASNECTATINATVDGMIERKKAPDGTIAPDRKDRMEKLRLVLQTRCAADAWPPEMLACMKTVSAQPDLMKCQGTHLPPEAQTRLQAGIMGAMMGGAPPGGAPPGGAMPPSHAP